MSQWISAFSCTSLLILFPFSHFALCFSSFLGGHRCHEILEPSSESTEERREKDPTEQKKHTSRTGFLKVRNIFKNRQISVTEIQLGTSELEKYKVQKDGFFFHFSQTFVQ